MARARAFQELRSAMAMAMAMAFEGLSPCDSDGEGLWTSSAMADGDGKWLFRSCALRGRGLCFQFSVLMLKRKTPKLLNP